ncbi:MAG: 50S ribosomal protein L13 [Candidatus Moranbacteria bacterium RIFOXYA12_FULL_35_19]|nr:MAG: 50S ribosomal protein L13 [Candidatus Moranbacteria bacterium GW2011_GWF2_35_39]OGI30605.1 MAG: 50S ribosomal protein L13 [Candidatus Moranbacteria bacterium RIFOXYB12_FULL_35_8]OGI32064.1 MAG: 50S ribosomal protein L13 [Candidatus Moranbacteria bacterium RIFOXYC12_FULL_36_13]OGI35133.1 MAG: 50S ribosomal protein L13 [Candidatus Moranbacteria bacterium RIFOXYA12_FULL_35_19]
MKTINRKYNLFDAEKETLGRMATKIATVLRGKNKADFTPNIDGGDFAVVINSDKLQVTGNKMEGKIYHYFSGYPGGIRSVKLKDQMEKDSTKVIQSAVYGMLPKNKLRNPMMKRLLIYKDEKHPHKIN